LSNTKNGIKEHLITLAELQQVDLDITALNIEVAAVQDRLAEFEGQVTDMAAQVNHNRRDLEEIRKLYRDDESENRNTEDAIIKTRGKLNSVKTNKEYQAMLKAIDDLKQKNSNLEDKMLDSLDKIEKAEAYLSSLEADFEDLKQEVEEKQAEITATAEDQRQKINRLQQEREVSWNQLPVKWQNVYQRAIQQGKGIGVAAVDGAVCQVCRVNIPPQLYIDLMRMNSMQMCPNCQRIIYPNTIWENNDNIKMRPE